MFQSDISHSAGLGNAFYLEQRLKEKAKPTKETALNMQPLVESCAHDLNCKKPKATFHLALFSSVCIFLIISQHFCQQILHMLSCLCNYAEGTMETW